MTSCAYDVVERRSYRTRQRQDRSACRSIQSEIISPVDHTSDSMVRLFNFSRIPCAGSDAFSVTAADALHLTLLIDDFYYSVDVFGPPTSDGEVPEPLSVTEIEARFKAAVNDARTRQDKGEKPPQVGLLTADARDTWMKVGVYTKSRPEPLESRASPPPLPVQSPDSHLHLHIAHRPLARPIHASFHTN